MYIYVTYPQGHIKISYVGQNWSPPNLWLLVRLCRKQVLLVPYYEDENLPHAKISSILYADSCWRK
jgi:hypothetical protein